MTGGTATPEAREEEAARLLREAALTGFSCAPVRSLIGHDDIDAAYRVQQRNINRAVADGARIVGRKIGLTSAAVQRQVGVDQPDFGTLLDSMWFEDGRPIPVGAILQPRLEAEVALVLSQDLDLERPTVVDLVRAIDFVVPAFEIVGSRVTDWDIAITDTVADNASAGGFVLGGPFLRVDQVRFAEVTMSITASGTTVSTGNGQACLGSPLNAATWLARRLASLGMPLRAGDVVLTGALGPLVTVSPTIDYVASFDDFGSVRTRFAGSA